MKVTTIEIPIYNVDIVLVISEDWSIIKKKYGLEIDQDDLGTCAITLTYPGDKNNMSEIYLIMRPEYLDYNTLCHELLHIVTGICMLKGIEADIDNDEPLAYLQGFIGEKLFEFRDKYQHDEKIKEDRVTKT